MKHATALPVLKKNIDTPERGISAVTGSALLIHALTGKKNYLESIVAGYLLFRGITGHCPLSKLADKLSEESPKGVEIKVNMFIKKTKLQAFAGWRDLANLPLFMTHLKNVTEIDETNSSWEAEFPGYPGLIKWESEIITESPGEYIAWKSLPDSKIEHSGVITFTNAGKAGTEVEVHFYYHAPAGKTGKAIAKIFTPLFEDMLKEDVNNFKDHIETAEAASDKRGKAIRA